MLGNDKNKNNNNFEYISLQDATRFCNYSQEYLSLRARQGKLKSMKLGRNWVTTKEWLVEYAGKVEEYNGSINNNGHKKEKTEKIVKDQIVYSPPDNLPIVRYPKFNLSLGTLRPGFAAALVLVLITAGGVFGKESLSQTYNDVERGAQNLVQNIKTVSDDVFTATINYKGALVSVSGTFSDYTQWLKESYVSADKKVEQKIGSTLLSLAPEEAGQWVEDTYRSISRNYSNADEKVEQKIGDISLSFKDAYSSVDRSIERRFAFWAEDFTDGYLVIRNSFGQRIVKNPVVFGNFVKQKLIETSESIKNFEDGFKSETMRLVRSIGEPFVKIYQSLNKAYRFVTSPWREVVIKEESAETEEVVVKRVEVSKVVESVKEVTKETIQQVTKIDDAALAEVRANMVYLEEEIGKRLYAPGGVVSQTIYVTEPVSSPKIYQENGEIVLQTLGSGNVILSAATGLQLFGKQVVIESTSLLNPLIYLAANTRIDGDTTITGTTSVGGGLSVGGTFSSGAATFSGDLTVTGNASVTGDLTIVGNETVTGVRSMTASSTSAVLTVTQTGTGDILDLVDGSTTILTVADGGKMTITPTNPTLKGYYQSSTYIEYPTEVFVAGKYAYVTGYLSDNLTILDITNPASPSYVGSYASTTTLDYAHDVWVSGKYAYVLGLECSSLTVLDISEPASPSYVGSYTNSAYINGAASVYISGKYAYVASYFSDSLTIFDISNPTSPSFVSSYASSTVLDYAYEVYVSGDYAYIVGGESPSVGYFTIINISNPASPSYVSSYQSSDYLNTGRGVWISGRYAYLVGFASDALLVLDISNPASPSYVGSYQSSTYLDGPNTIQIAGKYAYVPTQLSDGVAIIDISNPASPSYVGSYQNSTYLDGPAATFVSGPYLYAAGEFSDSFVVLDISGIDVPAGRIGTLVASTLETNENAIIGNNLYVRNGLNIGYGGAYIAGETASFASSSRSALTIMQSGAGTIAEFTNTYNATNTAFKITNRGAGSSFLVEDSTSTDSSPFVIDMDGNVGIGTTTAGYKLDVWGGFQVATTTGKLFLVDYGTGYTGIATSTPRSKLDVWGDLAVGTSTDTNTPLLYVDSGNGYGKVGIGTTTLTGLLTVGTTTPSLVVASNGYVGIGTTTPEAALHVVGEALITGNIMTVSGNIMPFTPRDQDIGSAAYDWANIYTDNLYANNIGAASTSVSGTTMETFTINSDTAADATSSLRFYRGSDAPHALLSWDSDYDRFNFNFPLYFSGTGSLTSISGLTLSSGGTSNVILSPANYVGVATTSPRYKLDVWGDMAVGTSTDTNTPLLYVDSGNGYGSVGIGTTTLAGTLLTVGTTTPSLVVASNGYVGIATSVPSYLFSVQGQSFFSATTTIASDLVVSGAMKNVATKIVAATSTPNYAARADYVCSNNCATQINAAINALPSDGGVIYLLEGTYTIGSAINVGKANTSIIGAGFSTKLLANFGSGSNMFLVYAQNVRLSNMELDGNNFNVSGVKATGNADNLVIENLSIKDMAGEFNTAICLTGDSYIGRLENASIRNNIIKARMNYHGIYINGWAQLITISNNVIYNADNAIYIYGPSGVNTMDAGHNIITGNTISSTTNTGIYIWDTAYNNISNNIVTSSHAGIYINRSRNNTIDGNISAYNTAEGIGLVAASNNIVSNNIVHDNTNEGVYVYPYQGNPSSNNTITGNLFFQNGYGGIKIYGGDYNLVTGNTFKDNSQAGANLWSDVEINDTATYNLVSGNNFFSTSTKYAVEETTSADDFNMIVNNMVGGVPQSGAFNILGAHTTFAGNKTETTGEGLFHIESALGAATTTLTVKQSGTGDILNLFDGATEVFTVVDGGNVGIATSTPRYKLDVWGDMAIGTSTGVTVPMNYPLFYTNSGEGGSSNGVGIGTTTVSGTMLTVGTTTPALVVADSGYVGIGTASPTSKLEITGGDFRLDGDFYLLSYNSDIIGYDNNFIRLRDTNTGYMAFDNVGGYGFDFKVGGSDKVRIDGSGKVGIGTAGPSELLTVFSATDPTLQIGSGSATTTIIGNGTSTFPGGLIVDTSTLYLMSDLNRIGVATTTPRYTLDVWGSLAIGTSTSPIFLADTGSTGTMGITVGADISVGSIQVASSSGAITFVDMVVEGSAAAGTEESYSFQIDSQELFRIYAESDGLGGIQNKKIIYPSGVQFAISTTTPRYTLDVWGDLAVGTSTGVSVPMNYPLLYVNSGDGGSSNGVGIGTTTVSGTMFTVGTTTPALVVSQNGYVGIGTTGPSSKLEIITATQLNTHLKLSYLTNNVELGGAYGYLNVKPTSADYGLLIRDEASDSYYANIAANNGYASFNYNNDVGVNSLNIDVNGNVGIGNTGPSSKLTVSGGNLVVSSNGSATSTISSATSTLAGGLIVDTDSLYVMADTGYVGIGTKVPYQKLDVVGGLLVEESSGGYMMDLFYSSGNSRLGFYALADLQIGTATGVNGSGWSSKITILNNGNVGIATSSPRYKLDVWGDMAVGTSTNTNIPALYIDSGEGGRVGIGTTTLSGLLTVGTTTPSLVVAPNGYVGIGTATPGTTLTVNGTVTLSSGNLGLVGASHIYATDASANYIQMADASNGIFVNLGYPTSYFKIQGSTNDSTAAALNVTNSSAASLLYVRNDGNVGIGTTTPASKLTINESNDFAFGDFNASTVDTMEATSLNWHSNNSTLAATSSESTIVKTGGAALKITSSGACEDVAVRKIYSSPENFSAMERLSFWIYADKIATSSATTTQLISIGIYNSANINNATSTHQVSIQEEDKWQYEEWNISGLLNATSVDEVFFRIDANNISVNFYIDQIRLYDSNERSGEMFVGKDGALVMMGRGGVEIGTADGSSNKPGIRVDSAIVEFNQPMSVNVGGDVGMDNDLQFLSTGLSQITSEGPLRIAAGDSNHSENLTLATNGSGDVIVDLTASSSAFMVMHAWAASTTVPFIINSESNSTTTVELDKLGILFQVISDYGSDENTVFSIDASGNFYYDRGAYTPAADVAENYYVQDESIESGDVVCLGATSLTVEKCSDAYESDLIGVISTQPALLMGNDMSSARPVALNGRVPVKISLENGSIAIGDSLTSASSTPGVAMKATGAGKILGYALEPFDENTTSSDMIYAFINLQDRSAGELSVFENSEGNLEVQTLTQTGLSTLFTIDDEGALVVDKIKTQQLCVGSVCVTENEFMQVFGAGVGEILNLDSSSTDSICTNGANQPCSSEVGACQIGVQICENGTWGECIGAVLPADELCDEVDNDCDGEVDEGVACSIIEPEPEPIATSTEPISTSTEPIITTTTTPDFSTTTATTTP